MSYDYDYNIWVRNEEYYDVSNKDRAAALRRAQADRAQAAAREKLNQANAAYRTTQAQTVEQVNRQLEKDRVQFAREIAAMDARTQAEIERLRAQMNREVSSLRQEANAVNRRLDQTNEQINALSLRIKEEFAQIAQRLNDQKDRATLHRNALDSLMEELTPLHPDKLTTLEQIALENTRDDVRRNLNNSDYEAAISRAQDGIERAAALRVRLEQLNEEYRRLSERLEPLLSRLCERFAHLADPEQNRRIFTVSGEDAEYDGEIDYWTFSPDTGASLYTQLLHQFEQLYAHATEDYLPNMNLDGLRDTLNRLTPMEAKLEDCVRIAHQEFQLTCQVELMADRICDAMCLTADGRADINWGLDEITPGANGHMDDDLRRAYGLRFQNGAGDIASIVVMPDRSPARRGTDPVSIRLDVQSGGPRPNPVIASAVYNEVAARLNSRGITVMTPDTKDRTQAIPSFTLKPDAFVAQATAQGDRARVNQLAAVRSQMKL